MDAVIQKAVELGVSEIAPLASERTEVKLDAEREARRMAHWRGVVLSACEQCGRASVPDLHAPRALPDWAAALPAGPLRLALAPGGSLRLSELAIPAAGVVAVVGPEGGLSDRDLAALDAAGFQRLALGPRVLRTETAGPALLAALQARAGDLG
jgi:16S rRNA (uracil1498-N3)-methyltransferase